jgi:hypothetical protein
MAGKSFDPKCYELAEHFLSGEPDIDTEPAREDLANEIQRAIEAWIEEWRTALQRG